MICMYSRTCAKAICFHYLNTTCEVCFIYLNLSTQLKVHNITAILIIKKKKNIKFVYNMY